MDSPINIPRVAEELMQTLSWERKKHKPYRKHKERKFRTRKDPFEQATNEIKLAVQLNPALQAKQLFEELQERHRGMFKGDERRTLQRRVATIRESLVLQDRVDLEPDTVIGACLVRN